MNISSRFVAQFFLQRSFPDMNLSKHLADITNGFRKNNPKIVFIAVQSVTRLSSLIGNHWLVILNVYHEYDDPSILKDEKGMPAWGGYTYEGEEASGDSGTENTDTPPKTH